jgi:hypothetical protein
MTRDEIASFNPNAVLWDGLDEAIIGLGRRTDFGTLQVYDTNGLIEVKLDFFYEDELEDPFSEENDIIDNWGRATFEDLVVYDVDKIIKILMVDMEVDELYGDETIEESKYSMAMEHFSYNIAGGYVGENTPIHLMLELVD